jgi:sugar phosphate isomerase/epimerase
MNTPLFSGRAMLQANNSSRAALRPTRREMLAQTVAGLGASWALANLSLADEADSPPKDRPGVCTLGFSTYGMQKLGTEQALKAIAEIGFDAVELSVRTGWDADSAALSATRRAALRNQLGDLQLRLSALMEHIPPTDQKNQTMALERLKLAGALAHDLVPAAPPLIQTVLGGGQWAESKTQLRDYLGEWMKLASELNILIAIKPHRGGALSQPADAIWLIEQLGQPKQLKMVYDYSHYAFRKLPLAETVEGALPFTAHVAVKDAAQENGKVVFKLPGEAQTIDYPTLLKQFYSGGYRGDFNCEVSGMVSGEPGYDAIAAAKICYVNMAKAFEIAEVPRPGR